MLLRPRVRETCFEAEPFLARLPHAQLRRWGAVVLDYELRSSSRSTDLRVGMPDTTAMTTTTAVIAIAAAAAVAVAVAVAWGGICSSVWSRSQPKRDSHYHHHHPQRRRRRRQ